MSKKDPTARVIRTKNNAEAGILINENSISIIAGDGQNLIVVDKNGITIKGAISLVTMGNGIRQGGLFVKALDMISMIPSTIVTPFPDQNPRPPINIATSIMQDVALFMAMMI